MVKVNIKEKKYENKKITIKNSVSKQSHNNLGEVFNRHIKYEFEEKDVDKTMKTMTNEPYVHHVPILTGGKGYEGVYKFYKNSFVGKMTADTKVVRISRTVSNDQVVDELILSFTHDIEIPAMLPGISPTGRYVELPHVVVMKFKGNKIDHEHIYWDQASLLAQIGLLDNNKELPITGIEQSKKLQELALSTQKKSHKKTIETIANAKT
ncbi:MAG: ester cyclase [Deltaproteobacteria bacterium]|nr:ester cyclase [Nitrososphaeraceae archaeon]